MPPQPNATAPRADDRAAGTAVAILSRCFIALWPDPGTRDQLDALASRVQKIYSGSRRTQTDQLHLTLAFIGPIKRLQANRVAEMLHRIDVPAFVWTLDRCAGFEGGRLLWVGGQDDPRLTTLAQAVRTGLDELRVGYDRKPFAAHVTLLRNVGRRIAGLPLDPPIGWSVGRPCLVISERDSMGKAHYRDWKETNPC